MSNFINPNMYPNTFNQLPMLDQNLSNLLKGFSNFLMAQGAHFAGRFDQKSHFSAIWSSLMVFNPFIWTADQLLMLGKVPTNLTNEFKVLHMTHRGSPGAHRGHFCGQFDQKAHFRPFGHS